MSIASVRASVANLLRNNIAQTRKPGTFLNRLAESISPRKHFWPTRARYQATQLSDRQVSIEEPSIKVKEKQLASLYKARSWATGYLKKHPQLLANKEELVKTGLELMNRGQQLKAVALFELHYTERSDQIIAHELPEGKGVYFGGIPQELYDQQQDLYQQKMDEAGDELQTLLAQKADDKNYSPVAIDDTSEGLRRSLRSAIAREEYLNN
ncbi:hypothetical protein [Parendozoicomonas haliclonae]|uniref:Uncharacterized protein n=1 Tax=Parendozoicomonas haliclonae TaxID=1960125 RepID=A0A1X7AI51_9GAMM|nr:hypothetical protein [Parendozoicomonas haliclonae]SMA43317.1 hypothetical protein EHSB41UT_01574 [Parendozoicomonas haliclonae]